MNIISVLEQEQLRKDIPDFRPGDTVKVHVKVVEGNRERVQVFEGVVIGRQNGGVRETFTVRRVSYGIGVERTFLVHSPRLAKIEYLAAGLFVVRNFITCADLQASCPYSRTPIKRSEKDSRQGVFFLCLFMKKTGEGIRSYSGICRGAMLYYITYY